MPHAHAKSAASPADPVAASPPCVRTAARSRYAAHVRRLPSAATAQISFAPQPADLAAVALLQRSWQETSRPPLRLQCIDPFVMPDMAPPGAAVQLALALGEVEPAGLPQGVPVLPLRPEQPPAESEEMDGDDPRLCNIASWCWEVAPPTPAPTAWAWLAALGCVAEGLPKVGWLVPTLQAYTRKYIKQCHALCEVACLAPAGSAAMATLQAALVQAPTPRALMHMYEVELLQELDKECNVDWHALARNLQPQFMGRLVLVEVSTAWRLEARLVALAQQRWPGHIALVGNLPPGAAAVRYVAASSSGICSGDFLRSMGWRPSLSRGARACGSMPLAQWHQALQQLGLTSHAAAIGCAL